MPITYKCPNCGAAMEFDSTAQKLKCPSCQMEMDVQDYESSTDISTAMQKPGKTHSLHSLHSQRDKRVKAA